MRTLEERLEQNYSLGLTRNLTLPKGVDFSSNDYLGFAEDDELKRRCIQRLQELSFNGAGGSRLLRGNLAIYEQTETMLADFVKRDAALLFSSGYLANLALFSSLPQANDIVFSDELNHASMIDGLRLSKAKKIRFPHRDYQQLEELLKTYQRQPGLKIIATESLFSMQGTLADLNKLADLADAYEAILIVDEAHSMGIWGNSLIATLGLNSRIFASIHPAGKALGASGAWVAGSQLLQQYLINFGRPFIFSTAPIPALAIQLQEAVKFHQTDGLVRAKTVRQRAKMLRSYLAITSDNLYNDESPIIAVPIGNNENTVRISLYLQQMGWDIRPIRPPSVPEGKAQLRITVKWCNSDAQIKQLATDLVNILDKSLP